LMKSLPLPFQEMPVKGCQVSSQDSTGGRTQGAGHIALAGRAAHPASWSLCLADPAPAETICLCRAPTARSLPGLMGWWKQELEQWPEILKFLVPGERDVLSVVPVWVCRQAGPPLLPHLPYHNALETGKVSPRA